VQPGDPTGPRPVDGAVRGQLGERHPAGCCCRAATPCL
jgi:hypothetical protein